MATTLDPATPESLEEIIDAVATWQHEGGPVQVHPGDLAWHGRFGAEQLAEALRVWRRDGQVLAVGLVDSPELVRMSLAPGVDRDDAFAADLAADLTAGFAVVEARFGAALQDVLVERGWVADEPWTPLHRDLTGPVEECGLRIEVVGEDHVAARVAVQRAAFPTSTFTPERWRTMAAAPAYRRARCLVGYDDQARAVAVATVWSAGRGRPGLLEPVGVHPDQRGRGHGTAISLAAAAALREMGASSATVCTPSSNVGAVAAYASAGFRRLPDVTDFRRPDPR